MPKDIRQCLKLQGVNIPDAPLTAGQVEKLWSQDRLVIVKLRQCGARADAWYAQLRASWR